MVFYRSVFVPFLFGHCNVYLRLTASDYPFNIFKLFFLLEQKCNWQYHLSSYVRNCHNIFKQGLNIFRNFFWNKNVDIKFSAHDALLKRPSSGSFFFFKNHWLYLSRLIVIYTKGYSEYHSTTDRKGLSRQIKINIVQQSGYHATTSCLLDK